MNKIRNMMSYQTGPAILDPLPLAAGPVCLLERAPIVNGATMKEHERKELSEMNAALSRHLLPIAMGLRKKRRKSKRQKFMDEKKAALRKRVFGGEGNP